MGLFLLLVALRLGGYLATEFSLRGAWNRMPTLVFVFLALGICGLSGLFFLALGPQEVFLALALGVGITLSFFIRSQPALSSSPFFCSDPGKRFKATLFSTRSRD